MEQDGSTKDSYDGTTKNLHGAPSLLKGEDGPVYIPHLLPPAHYEIATSPQILTGF
jgi:hypothetical protein